jgi:CBS domain-containing protein
MDIASLCRREIVTIDEHATLRDAAALMRSHHVGALVVTATEGDKPRVVGIVTDRDLAVEVLARDLAVSTLKIGQIASRPLAAVPAHGSIGDALAAMQRAGVRRLLVVEQDGRLGGFISSDDLLEALAGQLGLLAGALRAGMARENAERKPVSPPAGPPVFLPQGTPGWKA